MAWPMLAGAVVCLVLAVALPIGTAGVLLLLLTSLLLLLFGTLRRLGDHRAPISRSGSTLIDSAELERLRVQIETRWQPPDQRSPDGTAPQA